jgi:hypothetical protein
LKWEEVVDPEYGLRQDEWSLHGGADGGPPVFGEYGQLKVVGWSGRYKGKDKHYILKCNKCSQDSELLGEGYFRCLKGRLVRGALPCGCSKRSSWSKEQFSVLCARKASSLGYKFLGFVGEWKGAFTRISILCEDHGEWSSGTTSSMVNHECGCPGCRVDIIRGVKTKPDDVMITSFFKSGAFHPDTKFWRSERETSQGYKSYWYVFCPECGETGEALSGNLQQGQRPCACSKQRQQECYINWIVDDHNNAVAIKFGIARDSKQRIKKQNKQSIYEIRQYLVYTFPDVASCKKAERECKKELVCGVIPKTDMKDGWTETTSCANLGKVKSIFERNGGICSP